MLNFESRILSTSYTILKCHLYTNVLNSEIREKNLFGLISCELKI